MKDYKILVVDDFDTMIRIIKNILEELGYLNVLTARNGAEAWKILNKEKIDFIISDWNMPQMTGYDLLLKVKETPAFDHIPFLLVTAEAEKNHIMAALKAKVNQYIIKPFTTDMLKEKIELAIKSQGKYLSEKND